MLCHFKVSKQEQKMVRPTLLSPEIKDSQEKNYKKGNNHLHAVSLQQWNPIVHLTYKNFISCKNDPTLFDTGLNSLNTFLYKICTDF